MKKSDIERLEEEVDRQIWGRSASGGRKTKQEHHGKKTQHVIYRAAAEAGKVKRKEASWEAIRRITDTLDDTQLNSYRDWLIQSLADRQQMYRDGDVDRHTYTSGGHGGTGRQTSRNAWDIIHRPTRIRVTSQDSRLAGQNWEWGKKELTKRLARHLAAWKIVLPEKYQESQLQELITDKLDKKL